MKTLPKNLAPISSVCGEPASFYTDSVQLKLSGAEYTVVATNGKIALQLVGAVNADETPDPRDGTEALIDAKTWKQVFTAAAKDRKCERVAVSVGDKDAEFRAGGCITRTEVGEARFPDISGAIPKSSPTATVRLNAGRLLSLVSAIKAVAGIDANIEFEIHGKDAPVVLRVSTETEKLTGLIVSC